jgi:hypothetical protein
MQAARHAQGYRRNMNDLGVLEDSEMLYYNINMSEHRHVPGTHHPHHPGHVHPPASVSLSILRMSVLQRLSFAAGLIALIWAATFWAMQ